MVWGSGWSGEPNRWKNWCTILKLCLYIQCIQCLLQMEALLFYLFSSCIDCSPVISCWGSLSMWGKSTKNNTKLKNENICWEGFLNNYTCIFFTLMYQSEIKFLHCEGCSIIFVFLFRDKQVGFCLLLKSLLLCFLYFVCFSPVLPIFHFLHGKLHSYENYQQLRVFKFTGHFL